MSEDESVSKRNVNVWMALMAVVLVALSVWVVVVTSPTPESKTPPKAAPPADVTHAPADPRIPIRDELLHPTAPHFGISAPRVPWSKSVVDGLAQLAGRSPTMMEYFVNWTANYDSAPVVAAYQQGAIPVLSWQPWAGIDKGESQPTYALSTIINGGHDAYITAFATAVRDAKWPVVLRFAHEMNGNWYPWSEQQSGNRRGEFVKAWRHVHDVFQSVGATNVIWAWSPNILRPVPKVDIQALFPGNDYVDWVGFVGYGVNERTASQTFDPTITAIRKFTQLPLLISETGAQPGPDKTEWTADFFRWLVRRTDVVGFIWFQYSRTEGGSADWRFNSDAASLAAFRSGLSTVQTAPAVSLTP